ncbi:MAG: SpoIIE family protein phosphatase [Planctomycetes bacterium]|nr:SpoIIE family protein phosphatase [Planctomycetota bacterium]
MSSRGLVDEAGILRASEALPPDGPAGLLQPISALYGALTRTDFLARVRELIHAAAGPVPYSIIACDRDEGFRLLWSSFAPAVRTALAPPAVVHPVLAACHARGESFEAAAGEACPQIAIEDASFPLVEVDPLVAGGRPVGVLALHGSPAPDLWEGAVRRTVCGAVAIGFRRLLDQEAREEELESYRARLEAINALGGLLGNLDIEVLLSKLMELAIYVTGAQVGSIVLLEGDAYVSRAEWGLSLDLLRAVEVDGRPLLDQVLRERSAVRIGGEDLARLSRPDPRVRIDSLISIPLVSEKRTLGAVTLVSSSDGARELSRLDMESIQTISGLAAAAMENAILHAEAVEKERLETSLRIAQRIQEGLYPCRAPEGLGLDFGWINRSCEETGGDYFDFLAPLGTSFAVAVGDVAGHGLGAALMMTAARSALRACSSLSGDIEKIVARLNDLLEEDMEADRFMTLFLASIDPASGAVRYINAGHDAPCLFRAATGTIELLGATGMPLGIDRGTPILARDVRPLAMGDVLLLVTDGIWEAREPGGAMFGKDRVHEILARCGQGAAQGIADSIFREFASFVGSAPIKDDVTLLAVKRIREGGARERQDGRGMA